MAYLGLILPATGERTLVDQIDFAGELRNAQIIKLGIGGEGAFTPLIFGRQVMASSLPVTWASDQPTLPVLLTAGSALVGSVKVVDNSGAPVDYDSSLTSAITSVAAVTGSATLLAQNTARKGATIFNDSTAILWIALANVTSSSTLFTHKMEGGGYYELPVMRNGPYRGIVKGTWASAVGNARVTEFT